MQRINYEPMPAVRKPATQRVVVHRYVPIDEDQPDLTLEDGLRVLPAPIILTPRQKLARAAVISVFILVAAAAGAIVV